MSEKIMSTFILQFFQFLYILKMNNLVYGPDSGFDTYLINIDARKETQKMCNSKTVSQKEKAVKITTAEKPVATNSAGS